MPRKVFYTKEYIIKAALQIVREEGAQALTVRAVAKKLGCSVCPVFTAFENMEDLNSHVLRAARDIYNQYIAEGLKQPIPFKGVGEAYVRFAIEEPKLFQLLFMGEAKKDENGNILPVIDENYKAILHSVSYAYNLTEQTALKLYRNLWIFTHGIASMFATRSCNFSYEEISEMLTDVFVSLLVKYKGENNDKG